MTFNYVATHQSIVGASPAMFLSRDYDTETITLINEDGFVWTDFEDEWEPIEDDDEDLTIDDYAFMNQYDDIYGDGIYDSEEVYLNSH